MKKLNRLQINSEKLMKNDELVTLRGGYGGGGGGGSACTCFCKNLFSGQFFGYLVSASGDCYSDCRYAFGNNYGNGGSCT